MIKYIKENKTKLASAFLCCLVAYLVKTKCYDQLEPISEVVQKIEQKDNSNNNFLNV